MVGLIKGVGPKEGGGGSSVNAQVGTYTCM
jgi:hypothetical protein